MTTTLRCVRFRTKPVSRRGFGVNFSLYEIAGDLLDSMQDPPGSKGKDRRLHSPSPRRILHDEATDQRANLGPDERARRVYHHWTGELLRDRNIH